MLLFLISFIEWAKLIVGSALIIMGAFGFLSTWLGWVLVSTASVDRWKMFALNHASMLIIIVVGFYIAGW